jgi:16S rRNA (cytosine1402-N4)-methyltransferase
MTDGERHISVLKQEVVQALAPKKGEIFVDATFGAGGYSLAILAAADCTVFAIDRDPNAIAAGRVLPEVASGRLHLLHGRFSEMEALLRSAGIKRVDGVTMDLGVSSMQIDEAARGFSFMLDGPLDMRMSEEGETAADIVNKAGEVESSFSLVRSVGPAPSLKQSWRRALPTRSHGPASWSILSSAFWAITAA